MKLLFKILVALFINIILFVVLSLTNQFIVSLQTNSGKNKQKQIVLATIKKPKPKPHNSLRREMRQVKSTKGRSISQSLNMDLSSNMAGLSSGNEGAIIASKSIKNQNFLNSQPDENAVLISRIEPEFPIEAKKLGIGGKVYTKFVVGVDGKVDRFESVNAPHISLAKAVKNAIKQWKFKPATKKGVPIEQKMEITINFNLEK